jgi:hypothetical protein
VLTAATKVLRCLQIAASTAALTLVLLLVQHPLLLLLVMQHQPGVLPV